MKISRRTSAGKYSVKYFNGFSLSGEETFFSEYLTESDYTVAGFSYGAQQALEYVYNSRQRIDRLILLSPAFFQTESKAFIRTQLRYYEADKEAYVNQFLANVSYPSSLNLRSFTRPDRKESLSALLNYVWDEKKIREIRERGVNIEVFLGEKDRIIAVKEAYDFFSPLATTYFMKDVGHILKP